jgi:hypothetical protein
MDEKENDLIEGKAEKERESRCDKDMASMLRIGAPPPLNGDGQHKKRNADAGNPDHQKIDDRALSCQSIDRLSYCDVEFVHGQLLGLTSNVDDACAGIEGT